MEFLTGMMENSRPHSSHMRLIAENRGDRCCKPPKGKPHGLLSERDGRIDRA